MRPLLFRRLLSQHPVLPTPEGPSRLHFQVLRRFHGLRYWLTSSAPSFPFRANISVLQDSLYVTGCCFALPSQEVTTFQHTRSPRCTGCLLPGRLFVTRTGLSPASRRQLFRTHEPVLGGYLIRVTMLLFGYQHAPKGHGSGPPDI
jgi:hypothetical protein